MSGGAGDGCFDFRWEFVAQAGLAGVIPDCSVGDVYLGFVANDYVVRHDGSSHPVIGEAWIERGS